MSTQPSDIDDVYLACSAVLPTALREPALDQPRFNQVPMVGCPKKIAPEVFAGFIIAPQVFEPIGPLDYRAPDDAAHWLSRACGIVKDFDPATQNSVDVPKFNVPILCSYPVKVLIY